MNSRELLVNPTDLLGPLPTLSFEIFPPRENVRIEQLLDGTVTKLCERLLEIGAPGLHFYIPNRWGASRGICRKLGFLER